MLNDQATHAQNKSLQSLDAKQAALNSSMDGELEMLRTNKNTQSFSQLMENSQDYLNAPNNVTITSSYHNMPQLQGYMLAHNASVGSIQLQD